MYYVESIGDAGILNGTSNRRWWSLVLLCAAQFMVVLDATIVLVALPSIGAALKFAPQDQSWVITAYTLLFGGFLLLGGRAADLFGRRRLFVIGLALFSFGSLLCALSPSSGLLVAARAVQGFGAAMVSPAALAVLTVLFSEGKERNQVLGIWGALGAIGAAAGLLLGGLLTTTFGWQSIFLVNVPIGVVALSLTPRLLPNDRIAGTLKGFDLGGAVTLTGGLVLLVYATVGISDHGLLAPLTLLAGGLAIVLLAAFVWIEAHNAQPLIRLSIFRLRQLTIANVINVLLGATQGGMFYLLTLYMQNTLHYSPLITGVAILPVALGVLVFSNIASRFVSARGVKPVMIGGLIAFIVGLLLLTRLPVDGLYLRDLLPTFIIVPIGMGFSFVALTVSAFIGVPAVEAGLASGLINTTGQIGAALGTALLGAIAALQTQAVIAANGNDPATTLTAQVSGAQTAFATCVGLVIVALVIAAIGLRSKTPDSQVLSVAQAAPSISA